MARERIIMECTDCRSRNYFTEKNRRKHPERVEWKKYCARCDKHQLHKESK
ncbi:MAG: 50S ribosomal protein L33 [Gemmatimonadota bacterium]